MINLVPLHAAGKPRRWILCFKKSSQSRLVRVLACGQYKHVRAFGYVEECDAYIFIDVRFGKTDVWTARGNGAGALMAYYAEDCDLIGMPVLENSASSFRLGFYCVPAVKHLIGLRGGALRPDALWRHCLRNGGEVIADGRSPTLRAAAA
jgi:hypothetical protein